MKILVTGSSGLVGSAVVERFCSAGHAVVGLDNDGRRDFFGPDGSTRETGKWLHQLHGVNFHLRDVDVRDTAGVFETFEREGPFDAVVHCAAQPSHDWAAQRPLDDFHVNAFGTLKVLEACRQLSPEAVFVFMSTNKVYGAELNGEPLVEREKRFEFFSAEHGVNEQWEVDQTMHALYGAGKLAADLYVQEYGRYYGMRTVCLRAGCITGAGHAAVPLHGFLSYLVKCNLSGTKYVVKGYGGKQVRDNLHAGDLAQLIWMIIEKPPRVPGRIYNIGGGKANSCSILEAFEAVELLTAKPMFYEFDDEPRKADHACYYTDLRRAMEDYPDWRQRDLTAIYAELVEDWRRRLT